MARAVCAKFLTLSQTDQRPAPRRGPPPGGERQELANPSSSSAADAVLAEATDTLPKAMAALHAAIRAVHPGLLTWALCDALCARKRSELFPVREGPPGCGAAALVAIPDWADMCMPRSSATPSSALPSRRSNDGSDSGPGAFGMDIYPLQPLETLLKQDNSVRQRAICYGLAANS